MSALAAQSFIDIVCQSSQPRPLNAVSYLLPEQLQCERTLDLSHFDPFPPDLIAGVLPVIAVVMINGLIDQLSATSDTSVHTRLEYSYVLDDAIRRNRASTITEIKGRHGRVRTEVHDCPATPTPKSSTGSPKVNTKIRLTDSSGLWTSTLACWKTCDDSAVGRKSSSTQ